MRSTKGLPTKQGSFCFLPVLPWRLTVPFQQLYSEFKMFCCPASEMKPLQTFSCKWIKMLLLHKEALHMTKCGGQTERLVPVLWHLTAQFLEQCKEITAIQQKADRHWTTMAEPKRIQKEHLSDSLTPQTTDFILSRLTKTRHSSAMSYPDLLN